MPAIDLYLDGDNAWPELREVGVVQGPEVWRLAALDRGMASGAPSLALRLDIDLDDGGTVPVVTQTSLAAWIAATCALRARFPDTFRGTPLEET